MGVINQGSLQDSGYVCRLQGRQTSIINNERQEILEGERNGGAFFEGGYFALNFTL